MIIDSIEKFTALIPTAEGTDWAALEPFMKEAEAWAKTEFLGDDLFTHIAGLTDNTGLVLSVLLANKAYSLAIPYVDLIQTANGFAVVQNSNQAPASQQRVDRLLQTTLARIGVKMDMLIGMIEVDKALLDKWKLAAVFAKMTETVFWRPSDMVQLGGALPTANWDKLTQSYAAVIGFQTGILADWISPVYMDELLAKRQSGTLSEEDKKVLRMIWHVVGLLISALNEQAEQALRLLVNYMETNAASFSTYINSDIYAIKMAAHYQNKKADSTFFFGT
jgi:hypothetical protein